jgi:DNA mismatch repair protein MutL
MSNGIGALPQDVVHLMAAGEVIDSLAAAVRELAENAIDSGADRVSITLWPHQWRIQVADNGGGMAYDDLLRAALPHTTSKIKTAADLWQIRSLGFRGEALYSLAQLSHLAICSRDPRADHGWQVQYGRDGQPQQVETVAIAPGTVVTVHGLFDHWLARRQGLPSMPQQLRQIQRTIQALALCHPHITWQVQQGDRPWFSIWAGETAREILPQCVREVTHAQLRQVSRSLPVPPPAVDGSGTSMDAVGQWGDGAVPSQETGVSKTDAPTDCPEGPAQLYLLLGLPDRCHRHRPDWIHIAVNGRIVRCPELEQTLLGAFRQTLPRDRYPVGLAQFTLPPSQVDWNRHPAKAELYLRDLPHWQEQLRQAIAHLLALQSETGTLYSPRAGPIFKSAESTRRYQPQAGSKSVVGPLRAIAQVHQMYIVAEHPTGLWLVEQHIAHERVLYERLCDRWHTVPLEPPITLPHLSAAQVSQLQRLGLEVDPFGDNLWAVRTAPAPLASRSDCGEALLELSRGTDVDAALVATACRTAIRNGTPLDLTAMQALLTDWQNTRQPHTCPHGRPICLALEESHLARFFRRHWVIGKSHGI